MDPSLPFPMWELFEHMSRLGSKSNTLGKMDPGDMRIDLFLKEQIKTMPPFPETETINRRKWLVLNSKDNSKMKLDAAKLNKKTEWWAIKEAKEVHSDLRESVIQVEMTMVEKETLLELLNQAIVREGLWMLDIKQTQLNSLIPVLEDQDLKCGTHKGQVIIKLLEILEITNKWEIQEIQEIQTVWEIQEILRE